MLKWLGAIGGWQGYLAAAVLSAALSVAATYYLVSMPYKLTISDMKTAAANKQTLDATASLKQLRAFISNMHSAAADYGDQQDALFAAIDRLHADFTKAANLKPLPIDCRPDDERLRILSASVAAANAAAAGHLLSRPVRGPQ